MEAWRRQQPHPDQRKGTRRRHVTVLAVLATLTAGLAVMLASSPAQAAPVVGDTPAPSWRVNGRVMATEIIGNTVIVGGNFTTATSPAGENVARRNLAAFRLDTGELIRSWQADAGSTVRALDHDGTWLYVGGAFGRVGGVPAGRMARVRISDATVDRGFHVEFDDTVRALDVRDGAIWAGGPFLHVDGEPRQRVARIDATTGALDPRFRVAVNNAVWGIVKNPTSDTVYISGNFGLAGGVARSGVAALDATTGAVRGTVFASSARPTLDLDVNDAGTRLFGAGGSYPNVMATWSTSTGTRVWHHVVEGDVQGTTHHQGKVYFGFHDGHQGNTRIKVLAADEATGVLDRAFMPRFDSFWGVFSIAASDAGVVVGGEFTNVSGVPAQGWARFPARGVSEPPPPPTSTTATYLTAASPWRYWDRGHRTDAWQTRTFDDSSWRSGAGHFGFGDGDENVLLERPTPRPTTYYFRTTFDVTRMPDELVLDLVADDGAVVHVNGVEVARDNMPAGPVTATTRAATNRSGGPENAARTFVLPTSALVLGSNTIAVEVHQDTPSSSDLSFAASLTGTVPATAPPVQPPPVDPPPVEPPSVDEPPVSTALFGFDTSWKWYYRADAPAAGWTTRAFDDASWSDGVGFLGWGAPVVQTSIDTFATTADRPVTAYFRKQVQLQDVDRVVSLRLEAVANDGAVVHVNGVEVGRQNMRDGEVTHRTYAPTARRHAVAALTPLVVEVPASLLVEGTNVIAVDTHVNWRATPDVTFGMTASVLRR